MKRRKSQVEPIFPYNDQRLAHQKINATHHSPQFIFPISFFILFTPLFLSPRQSPLTTSFPSLPLPFDSYLFFILFYLIYHSTFISLSYLKTPS